MTLYTEDRVNACRVLTDVFPANDVELLADLVADDFLNHEAPPGTPRGLGAVTVFMNMLSAAFSDQRWEIQDVIAEADKVVIRCTHHGVHTGTWFGLPATGRPFAYQQMHIIRMENGKGAEHWAVRDDAALMRQLTGSAPPGPTS